jgi:multimeric flavodoxin WrbA
MNGVTSQMKSFIDRSFSYLYHCRQLKGKHAIIIISSGGPELERVEDYLGNVLEMYGCWNVGQVVACEPLMDDDELCLEPLEQATELGQRLINAIVNKETFPEQVEKHDYYSAAMEFLIPHKKELFTWEYEYWKKHLGLIEEN